MPSQLTSLGGVVFAGGRSTRMGTDKALLEIEGTPLWRRQYNLLAQLGASERLLSVRPDQTWAPADVTRVFDSVADAGPLAGLVAALSKTRQSHLVALAVDLPRLPLSWLSRLRARCADRIGAIGRRPDGLFEPLAAIYPAAILPLAKAALAEKKLSLQTLASEAIEAGLMREEPIADGELAWFANWNSPEDINAPH